MAERRMFSKAVINSARFLTMPPSSFLSVATTGQTDTQEGFPHCIQGRGR